MRVKLKFRVKVWSWSYSLKLKFEIIYRLYINFNLFQILSKGLSLLQSGLFWLFSISEEIGLTKRNSNTVTSLQYDQVLMRWIFFAYQKRGVTCSLFCHLQFDPVFVWLWAFRGRDGRKTANIELASCILRIVPV